MHDILKYTIFNVIAGKMPQTIEICLILKNITYNTVHDFETVNLDGCSLNTCLMKINEAKWCKHESFCDKL